MGKSSSPPAPDYTAAAKETAEGNLENSRLATKANRVNYYTPYGNLTYQSGVNGDQDQWRADVSLSPSEQALLDQQNKTSAGLAGLQDAATQRVGQSLNSAAPSAYDPTKATNNASELINARLAPQQARDKASLENQLANQGIPRGSEAWNEALDQLGRTQNDAKQQAELQGINLGMSQQGQTYQQAFANRNAPLNELSAIRTGSQVTNPTFGNSAQQQYTPGADVLGAQNAQYGAAVNAANANNASAGGLFGGLTQLGGLGLKAYSAGLFSDRRLKSNIRRIGTLKGFNLYQYEKFGRMEVGVMAQEVMASRPDAVKLHDSGFYMVDYGAL